MYAASIQMSVIIYLEAWLSEKISHKKNWRKMNLRIQVSSSSRTLSCQLVCFPIEIMSFRISKLAKGKEEEYLESRIHILIRKTMYWYGTLDE